MYHVRHTLALMCAKNHLLIFSSFLDILENVEWPRFFGPPCICNNVEDYNEVNHAKFGLTL